MIITLYKENREIRVSVNDNRRIDLLKKQGFSDKKLETKKEDKVEIKEDSKQEEIKEVKEKTRKKRRTKAEIEAEKNK